MSPGMGDRGISSLPRNARLYQGRRAGLVSRVVAAGLDTVLVAVSVVAGYAVLAGVRFLLDPRESRVPQAGIFIGAMSILVVLIAYLALCWRFSGRTYGCVVMGLRVVDQTGRALRIPRALLRALLYAAFPIGLFWVALSKENHSVQDILLRTSVVYDWLPGNAPDGRVAGP